MSAGISRDEWLAALEEANVGTADPPDPAWVSIYDYAAIVGCHYNKARRDLKRLVQLGKAERRERRRLTEDGAVRAVVCYRLLKATKKR
jgi:hypothetical protein